MVKGMIGRGFRSAEWRVKYKFIFYNVNYRNLNTENMFFENIILAFSGDYRSKYDEVNLFSQTGFPLKDDSLIDLEGVAYNIYFL